jgi:hypothetical protein
MAPEAAMTLDEFLDKMTQEAVERFPDADFLLCALTGDGQGAPELVIRTNMAGEDAIDMVQYAFAPDAGDVIESKVVAIGPASPRRLN